jgi:hypothetical protein
MTIKPPSPMRRPRAVNCLSCICASAAIISNPEIFRQS